MKKLPRVLIVEDEPAIAELIAVNLRHNGFQPIWSEDGESAQRELDAVLPDDGDDGLFLVVVDNEHAVHAAHDSSVCPCDGHTVLFCSGMAQISGDGGAFRAGDGGADISGDGGAVLTGFGSSAVLGLCESADTRASFPVVAGKRNATVVGCCFTLEAGG